MAIAAACRRWGQSGKQLVCRHISEHVKSNGKQLFLVDTLAIRLRLIEIFDVKRLQMRYATSLIGGPSTLATFIAVYALFGPTFPGIYLHSILPGLSFAFRIPSQYTDCCHDREAELPLEFPDGTTPVTCHVSIYDGSTENKVCVGSLMDKASAPSLPVGSLYMEEVHVKDVCLDLN